MELPLCPPSAIVTGTDKLAKGRKTVNWFIDPLITFLTELRTMSLVSQVLTIVGFISFLAMIFIYPVRKTKRQAEASVTRLRTH